MDTRTIYHALIISVKTESQVFTGLHPFLVGEALAICPVIARRQPKVADVAILWSC
jgi:hypothetical protein